jgi:hypothetical protein
MVDAIEDLVVQPLLYQTLISDARQKAVSFDWEFVKEKWIKVLQ